MVDVYRAPMRSRSDDFDLQPTIDRALAMGLVGFGDAGADERLDRRVTRFGAVADGSFVWTRDADGLYWLGRIEGPLFHDDDGAAVDLVHVRPCRWVTDPVLEPDVPASVLATFARGGRNFQQTHDPNVGEQTEAIWRKRHGI
ncbi:GAF domain-containing protein [Mycobacterium barrassiae]|uniref:GAF domain-containing protein n=1 Tax=Mycobacterium barrassiae TaxID=319709 RepID=UPI002265B406|nr:GAF domain-containing protein [Mycobacterium barrassiae]MCV7298344.1 GAF domain-containing protein [Mycobacterium barrassiae]